MCTCTPDIVLVLLFGLSTIAIELIVKRLWRHYKHERKQLG